MRLLQELSNASRLEAVDAAFSGNPFNGSNFTAKWNSYNQDGHAVVKYQGFLHSAKNISGRTPNASKTVMLRVSKMQKLVNY